MGMTIAEKIIAAAAGVDSVKPGDIYTVSLDVYKRQDLCYAGALLSSWKNTSMYGSDH